MTGIYCFTNKLNSKRYVGQSVNIENRYKAHLNRVNEDSYFHNALKKYGIDNFNFQILIECPEDNLNYWEKFYIKYYCSNIKEFGYNLTEGGSLKLSEESIKKAVETKRIKYNNDPTYKENISRAQKRRFEDPNERYKCGNSTRGKHSWNYGLKGSNSSWLKGNNLPEYLKENLHKKHVGRIWVNNSEISKQIYPEELDNYIKLGYTRGRLYPKRNKNTEETE